MSAEKILTRARTGAFVLMALVALETARYTFVSFKRAYAFCFGDPDRWLNHWALQDGAVVDTALRSTYFAVWSGTILLSIGAFIAGLHVLNLCRKGQFFGPRTGRAICILGGVLSLAMLYDIGFQAIDLWVLTQGNPDGPRPIRWFYDPSDFKVLSMALILFLFGMTMEQAAAIEAENREFV